MLVIRGGGGLAVGGDRIVALSMGDIIVCFFSKHNGGAFLRDLGLPIFKSVSVGFASVSSPSLVPTSSAISEHFRSVSRV